jgi:hypothetical protein
MFVDAFEKQSSEHKSSEEKRKVTDKIMSAYGKGIYGGAAGSAALTVPMFLGGSGSIEDDAKIIKHMSKGRSYKYIPVGHSFQSGYAHKDYFPKPGSLRRQLLDSVTGPMGKHEGIILHKPGASTGILAHELGHAQNAASLSPKLRNLQHKAYRHGKFVGAIGGLGLATSDNEKVRKLAPYATAAGFAPQLIEEGRASHKAFKALKNLYGASGAIKKGWQMIPAFGTYAALAAGTTYGAHKASKAKDKKESK